MSARCSAVSNICGFLSTNTWIISTNAAISSTEGIDESIVYRYWIASSTQPL